MIIRNTLALLGLAVSASVALAQEPTADQRAVEYRQAIYKVVGQNMGPLVAMARGDIPYEAAIFTRNAQRIAFMATMIPDAFARDTSGSGHPTEALPRLWSEQERFTDLAANLLTKAEALVEVSRGGDIGTIRPAFGELGSACRACHDRYRAD